MKHVSILLLEQVNLAGLDNARQGLLEANQFLIQKGKTPMFDVQVVGVQKKVMINKGLFAINAHKQISEVPKTDLIIIPPVQAPLEDAIFKNSGFIPWICAQRQNGAEIVSLCMGAFILARTGLLDDKDCVTHWKAGDTFKSLFPKVNLVSEKILTDHDGLYTGGGAFSSVNLILYLIEKLISRECTVYCSKIFQVDLGRQSQSPFTIFKGQRSHADELVVQAQQYIESNYSEKFSIEEICDIFSVNRRTFERRFKKATANSPIEYIQRVRVEAAKKLLEEGFKTVSEIVFDVGYTDMKAFRDVFKKVTGTTPNEYKSKFCIPMSA
ncbi:GlxA family transcriptional regulator [Arthrospiribacter ruber]|uniref:Helix-turn-helix domain-containing protein n=1 Tax=Arthrospiribacter ruber TaxID=2487934 RepID=A0A951J5I2_9BACT|nr:helix-turn-helix domain-containing protein [Arthrospiribacter ruber]MBW3470267.1 helix-turn-helix domain-containing protein [Arthrospiribacter ruber]